MLMLKERQIIHTHTHQVSAVAHLHVKVLPHPVDPDPVEPPIRHVAESRAEDVRAPVRLQVIPDLQTPCGRAATGCYGNPTESYHREERSGSPTP